MIPLEILAYNYLTFAAVVFQLQYGPKIALPSTYLYARILTLTFLPDVRPLSVLVTDLAEVLTTVFLVEPLFTY